MASAGLQRWQYLASTRRLCDPAGAQHGKVGVGFATLAPPVLQVDAPGRAALSAVLHAFGAILWPAKDRLGSPAAAHSLQDVDCLRYLACQAEPGLGPLGPRQVVAGLVLPAAALPAHHVHGIFGSALAAKLRLGLDRPVARKIIVLLLPAAT
eukprot:scaffold588718_cov48-Prasinocladus_malaysianus.AAC.1